MQCKVRCVNFRRVPEPRSAFQLAFGVNEISDDWYRSTMGMIVTSLGTPQSAGVNFGCTLEHLGAPATLWEHLESRYSSLGQTSSLGTLLVDLEIIATTYRPTIFKTHVFSLDSHLCIYIATNLHTVYLDWLQAVCESNLRCA